MTDSRATDEGADSAEPRHGIGAPEQGFSAPVPGAGDTAWIPAEPSAPVATPSGHVSVRPAAEPPLPASPARAMAALIALAAAAFVFVTNEIAPLGLIRMIADDLGRSQSEIGLVSTTFAIVVTLSTLPLTLLTTRLPRRWLIAGTVAVWAVGVVVVAASDTFAMLLVGRVITAMGHALFWAAVTPAAAGMFPRAMRGRSVTRLMLGAAGAGVVGLPAATWLAQRTDWQLPFWILAVAGIVIAIAIAIIMPTFRTQESSTAHSEQPHLRRYIRVLVVAGLSTGAMALTWTYITPFFIDVTGFDTSTIPLLLLIAGGVGVVTTYVIGRYLDRWPVKSVAVGQGLFALMWLGLATIGVHPAAAIAMLVLQGVSWSILVASMVNWSMRHTTWSSDIGVGVYTSVFNLGNAVGSVAGAGLLAWAGAGWLPAASFVLTFTAGVLVWRVAPLDSQRRISRRSLLQEPSGR